MNKHNILFIGLDTHKEFVEVAYIEDQRGAKSIHLGRQPCSKIAIKKLARQFESKYPDATLHFVYEAGPCGYWIYRFLTSLATVVTSLRHPSSLKNQGIESKQINVMP